MNNITNIPINSNYLYNDNKETEGSVKPQQKEIQQQATPLTPLPGNAEELSVDDLWRMLASVNKELLNALSGTANENSDAKKALIAVNKESRITQLNERMDQLKKQAETEASQGIWAKIGLALGVIAVLITAPFNPVMAVIMVATMVAAYVIPKIVDSILKACGVDENTRKWVSVGLEIAIAVVGTIISFNPRNMLSSVAKLSKTAMTAVSNQVSKVVNMVKSLQSFAGMSQKAQKMINSVKKLLEPLMKNIQEFAKGGKLVGARINQATSVGSGITSTVSTGYSIKSAAIEKDLAISQAEQDEYETRCQQVLTMLNDAMKILAHAFESLFDTKSAERDFHQKMINVHM